VTVAAARVPRVISRILRYLPVAAALFVAAKPVAATMAQRLSLADVTREAARIVHGTVDAVRSGRDASGLPATWITLTVAHTLKGPAVSSLTIKQYGVAAPLPDGTITRVAGLPHYRAGDEVVLFLRGESGRGFTSPVGLLQGAYRVDRGPAGALVNGTEDLDRFLGHVTALVAGSS
jgi:hypothetical protein